jgi:hypothetical protein
MVVFALLFSLCYAWAVFTASWGETASERIAEQLSGASAVFSSK